jgi:hypothetical protein
LDVLDVPCTVNDNAKGDIPKAPGRSMWWCGAHEIDLSESV